MSDLEAAIAAEMKRQGCRRLPVGSPIYDCDTCREHLDVWIDGECEVVASAVRAGWNAAIRVALVAASKQRAMDYRKPIDLKIAVDIAIRALLSEGGDRD